MKKLSSIYTGTLKAGCITALLILDAVLGAWSLNYLINVANIVWNTGISLFQPIWALLIGIVVGPLTFPVALIVEFLRYADIIKVNFP